MVYGTAAQLRALAHEFGRGTAQTRAAAVANAGGRVRAMRERFPDADLTALRGRPFCAAGAGRASGPAGAARGVRVALGPAAAELWIDDYIAAPNMWGEGVSARDIREALDAVGSRDVVVHMNSGGGDYFEGVAIYRALAAHPGDVYVAVDALAASAASIVAMAGTTVGIGDGAFLMIHEASAMAYGTADDMLSVAGMLDEVNGEMGGFYARKAGGDVATWLEAMAAETWYGTDKAIEAGLADERLALPAVDPEAIDTDDDGEVDEEIAALFSWARPAAAAPPGPDPAPAAPAPTPDPACDDLFDVDNLTELLL
jgi:ATP-dependent protease ClpP protease subunit